MTGRDDRAQRPGGPLVVLDLDYRNGALELVLANDGDEPALDVKVSFSSRLVGMAGERVVSELPLFAGLGVLRPHKEVRVFYDTAGNLFAARRRIRPFTATVTWRDRGGRSYEAAYRHDIGAFRDLPQIVIPPG